MTPNQHLKHEFGRLQAYGLGPVAAIESISARYGISGRAAAIVCEFRRNFIDEHWPAKISEVAIT